MPHPHHRQASYVMGSALVKSGIHSTKASCTYLCTHTNRHPTWAPLTNWLNLPQTHTHTTPQSAATTRRKLEPAITLVESSAQEVLKYSNSSHQLKDSCKTRHSKQERMISRRLRNEISFPILNYFLSDLELHVALAASFHHRPVLGFHLTYICHWQAMADAVCHAAVKCFA